MSSRRRGTGRPVPALWTAAFLPGTPVLVPELTGSTDRADLVELRAACAAAVRRMLAHAPGTVVCLGTGTTSRRHPCSAWGTLAGLGVDVSSGRAGDGSDHPPDHGPTLPLALTLARMLLSAAGWAGPVVLQETADGATAAQCARLADGLPVTSTGWLVLADGSTARTARAPGGFDPRAEALDQGIEAALAAADPVRLAGVDRTLAHELGATGWAPWQVLAQAAMQVASSDPRTEIEARLDYAGAPLGVGCLVGTWTVQGRSAPGG